MTVLLSLLCGIVMLGLTAWTLRQWQRLDPLARLWDRFSRKLARRNLERKPWEGPRDYAQRIAAARPALAAESSAICALYERMRYASDASKENLRELKRRVAAFTT
jgi:hypothetical protein